MNVYTVILSFVGAFLLALIGIFAYSRNLKKENNISYSLQNSDIPISCGLDEIKIICK